MSGKIYCFSTVGDRDVYKAGHTQQTLASRLRSYLGPSKPRTIVATRDVDDSAGAEEILLSLMDQCSSFVRRRDLGREWFQIVSPGRSEEAHRRVQYIMDVAQLAVRCEGSSDAGAGVRPVLFRGGSEREEERRDCTSLPCMQSYYDAFDRFVQSSPSSLLEAGTDELMIRFESSPECPVFAEHVSYSVAERRIVARNRYPCLDQTRTTKEERRRETKVGVGCGASPSGWRARGPPAG